MQGTALQLGPDDCMMMLRRFGGGVVMTAGSVLTPKMKKFTAPVVVPEGLGVNAIKIVKIKMR